MGIEPGGDGVHITLGPELPSGGVEVATPGGDGDSVGERGGDGAEEVGAEMRRSGGGGGGGREIGEVRLEEGELGPDDGPLPFEADDVRELFQEGRDEIARGFDLEVFRYFHGGNREKQNEGERKRIGF